jgi:hypothetical protein
MLAAALSPAIDTSVVRGRGVAVGALDFRKSWLVLSRAVIKAATAKGSGSPQ